MTVTARPRFRGAVWCLLLLTSVFNSGCKLGGFANTPTKAGIDPDLIADKSLFEERSRNPAFHVMSEHICREVTQPFPKDPNKPPKEREGPYDFLALSGGFGDAAYAAGVLYGWSEKGGRPNFDVVTATSAGALVGLFAFLGPEYDELIKTFFTTVTTKDIRSRRAVLDMYLGMSGSSGAPLRHILDYNFTTEMMAKVASEHAKGRRFYVVTYNLDGRRPCNWDMTAIASKGTEECRQLFIDIMLATCSAPPVFPPVKIKIRIDGCCYEELHCDGGAVANASAQAPYIPPSWKVGKTELEYDADMKKALVGSNLWLIRCGTMYPDPTPTPQNIGGVISGNLASVVSNATSDEFIKIYLLSRFTGVNYHQTSIPEDHPGIKDVRFFKPEEMGPLFECGRCRAVQNTAWRTMPPGLGLGEANLMRGGPDLSTVTIEEARLALPKCFQERSDFPQRPPFTKQYSPGAKNAVPKR